MQIENYFKQKKLDLTKDRFWSKAINQKLQYDVISFISQCVLKLSSREFTRREIEESDFFLDGLNIKFKKPKSNKIMNETDKFVEQPLNFLYATGILNLTEKRFKNSIREIKVFSIIDKKTLNFIAESEANSLMFLTAANLKISDYLPFKKDLLNLVKKRNAKRTELYILRDKFFNFIFNNTEIKNKPEPPRKFNPFINVLAYHFRGTGTIGGHPRPIYLGDLKYNRLNFRDKNKPKDISRKEARAYQKTSNYKEDLRQAKIAIKTSDSRSTVYKYLQTEKPNPEVMKIMEKMKDRDKMGSQVHHIFSDSEFPELSAKKENLIYLNPQEHLQYAHPFSQTGRIDPEFQKVLIIAKLQEIKEDNDKQIPLYDLREFIHVLNVGFDTDSFLEEDSFHNIETKLNKFLFSNAMN